MGEKPLGRVRPPAVIGLLGLMTLAGSFLLIKEWHGFLDYARRGYFATVVLGLVPSLLAYSLWRGRRVLWWSPMALTGVGFLALAWISLFSASYLADGIQIAWHWTIAMALAYLLVPALAGEDTIASVYRWLALTAVGTAIVGIGQIHLGYEIFSGLTPAGSNYGNQNWAASAINLAAGPLVYVYLQSRSWWGRGGWMLALGLVGGFLIHTQTRSVWVAMAGQIVFLGVVLWRCRHHLQVQEWLSRSNSLGLLGALGLATVVGLTGHPAVPAPVSATAVAMNMPPAPTLLDENVTSRLAVYENTLHLIAAYPVRGVGLYNFGVRLPETSPLNHRAVFHDMFWQWQHTHNDWLQLWVELGLGFPLLVLAAVGIVIHRSRTIVAASDGAGLGYLFSVTACLGCACDMLFAFPLYLAMPPILLAFHVAVIERRGLDHGWHGSRWFPAPPRPGWALVVAVFGVLLLTVQMVFSHRQFAAEEYRVAHIIADADNDLESVLQLAPRVGESMPLRNDWLVPYAAANLRLALESERGRMDADYRGQRLEAGRKAIERSLAREPNYSYARYLLGMTLAAQGQPEQALVELDLALRFQPEHSDILWERGRLYAQIGRLDEATIDFESYKKALPDAAKAADQVLVSLYVLRARYDMALPILENLLRDGGPAAFQELLGICLMHDPVRKPEGADLLSEYYSGNPLPGAHDELGRSLLAQYRAGIPTRAEQGP